jgi:hypothetical protein
LLKILQAPDTFFNLDLGRSETHNNPDYSRVHYRRDWRCEQGSVDPAMSRRVESIRL